MKHNYEKEQLAEQKSIDHWMAINTIFTILNGLATLFLAILAIRR